MNSPVRVAKKSKSTALLPTVKKFKKKYIVHAAKMRVLDDTMLQTALQKGFIDMQSLKGIKFLRKMTISSSTLPAKQKLLLRRTQQLKGIKVINTANSRYMYSKASGQKAFIYKRICGFYNLKIDLHVTSSTPKIGYFFRKNPNSETLTLKLSEGSIKSPIWSIIPKNYWRSLMKTKNFKLQYDLISSKSFKDYHLIDLGFQIQRMTQMRALSIKITKCCVSAGSASFFYELIAILPFLEKLSIHLKSADNSITDRKSTRILLSSKLNILTQRLQNNNTLKELALSNIDHEFTSLELKNFYLSLRGLLNLEALSLTYEEIPMKFDNVEVGKELFDSLVSLPKFKSFTLYFYYCKLEEMNSANLGSWLSELKNIDFFKFQITQAQNSTISKFEPIARSLSQLNQLKKAVITFPSSSNKSLQNLFISQLSSIQNLEYAEISNAVIPIIGSPSLENLSKGDPSYLSEIEKFEFNPGNLYQRNLFLAYKLMKNLSKMNKLKTLNFHIGTSSMSLLSIMKVICQNIHLCPTIQSFEMIHPYLDGGFPGEALSSMVEKLIKLPKLESLSLNIPVAIITENQIESFGKNLANLESIKELNLRIRDVKQQFSFFIGFILGCIQKINTLKKLTLDFYTFNIQKIGWSALGENILNMQQLESLKIVYEKPKHLLTHKMIIEQLELYLTQLQNLESLQMQYKNAGQINLHDLDQWVIDTFVRGVHSKLLRKVNISFEGMHLTGVVYNEKEALIENIHEVFKESELLDLEKSSFKIAIGKPNTLTVDNQANILSEKSLAIKGPDDFLLLD